MIQVMHVLSTLINIIQFILILAGLNYNIYVSSALHIHVVNYCVRTEWYLVNLLP